MGLIDTDGPAYSLGFDTCESEREMWLWQGTVAHSWEVCQVDSSEWQYCPCESSGTQTLLYLIFSVSTSANLTVVGIFRMQRQD